MKLNSLAIKIIRKMVEGKGVEVVREDISKRKLIEYLSNKENLEKVVDMMLAGEDEKKLFLITKIVLGRIEASYVEIAESEEYIIKDTVKLVDGIEGVKNPYNVTIESPDTTRGIGRKITTLHIPGTMARYKIIELEFGGYDVIIDKK